MRRLCVFCGSKTGSDPLFAAQAKKLGELLAEQGICLVYGGGSVGLMGVIADAVLDAGGEVIGVLPEMLATKELLHPRVQQMHVVESMHARKAKMAELADAFAALPGGYGTLEELFEVVTWAQLGIHQKAIGLLNTNHYYDPLVDLIDRAIDSGLIKEKNRQLLVVSDSPEDLLEKMKSHQPPPEKKWLSVEET